MDRNKILARVKVVVTAAPTYLVGAAAVVTAFSEEIAKILPAGAGEAVARVALVVLSAIAAAIAIIRRVTPVLAIQRGLLPQGPPAPPVVPIDMAPPVDVPNNPQEG